MATLAEFQQLELRVATVKSAELHPKVLVKGVLATVMLRRQR